VRGLGDARQKSSPKRGTCALAEIRSRKETHEQRDPGRRRSPWPRWNGKKTRAFFSRFAEEMLPWASSSRCPYFPRTASEDTHVVLSGLKRVSELLILCSQFRCAKRQDRACGRDRHPRRHFARVEDRGEPLPFHGVRWTGAGHERQRASRVSPTAAILWTTQSSSPVSNAITSACLDVATAIVHAGSPSMVP